MIQKDIAGTFDDPAYSKAVSIKTNGMPEEMQLFAIELAKEALEKCSNYEEMAKKMKLEFDKRYGATWHCIVGTQFGSYLNHEANRNTFFFIGREGFLLWKTV